MHRVVWRVTQTSASISGSVSAPFSLDVERQVQYECGVRGICPRNHVPGLDVGCFTILDIVVVVVVVVVVIPASRSRCEAYTYGT